MAAQVINNSGVPDVPTGWRSYYIRIRADGADHFKFGISGRSVKSRYSKEPSSTEIEVRRIWMHETEREALQNEAALLAKHLGDRPYFGRCGPLQKGGNTETYSHDVLAGEPPPPNYIVRMIGDEGQELYATGYVDRNPKEPYRDRCGQVGYMEYAFGPRGTYLQIPWLSHPKAVTLATTTYVLSEMDRYDTKRHRRIHDLYFEALRHNVLVTAWSDYSRFRFDSTAPFRPDQWATWV